MPLPGVCPLSMAPVFGSLATAATFSFPPPPLSFSHSCGHQRLRFLAVAGENSPQTAPTVLLPNNAGLKLPQSPACMAADNQKINSYRLAIEGSSEEDDHEGYLQEFIEKSMELIRMDDDGPPRWFSPLECGIRSDRSPMLLYLPGILGLGTELWLQQKELGKHFDIWCLCIPLKDRTSFSGLVQLVEQTIRSEYMKSRHRPIYLVGESLGACLALAVAARNPEIDLTLILANPGTSFDRSSLQHFFAPVLENFPDQLCGVVSNFLNFVAGGDWSFPEFITLKSTPRNATNGLGGKETSISSHLMVLASHITKENFRWRLEILKAAAAYTNARLHSAKSTTLVLASGKDTLLPSKEEAFKIQRLMSNCEVRVFEDNGHHIFLEENFNLMTIIKLTSLYKRGRNHDYVADFIPATPREFKWAHQFLGRLALYTAPVLLSTLEDGRIVRGLSGLPVDGPVLYVGYHMLTGLDSVVLVPRLLAEGNIHLRGLAHPIFFKQSKGGLLSSVERLDLMTLLGAVPVSGENLYKLLRSKSHVLLYPGGVREAFHRKGEEYKIHWPEQHEFIRMAAKFGAKIVPFGTVGIDDLFEILLDYNDQMKIPILREAIKRLNAEIVALRRGNAGEEVGNQELHLSVLMPKVPGRFYYLFGKPIETKGRSEELLGKAKAQEVYAQVKAEVEKCMAFLRDRREGDPYRHVLSRAAFQVLHPPYSPVPTFHIE